MNVEDKANQNQLSGCHQDYSFYEYPAYTFDKKYENDEFQKKVITLDSGYHLVLAPPGCGKTDILAERVVLPSLVVCRWMTCSV